MERTAKPFERYLILYIPWVLSMLAKDDPIAAYLIAWAGSFFIFFIVYSGWLKALPTDRKIAEQLMRPVFLIQVIFVGYMACSSIFYFLNLLGYGSNTLTIVKLADSDDALMLAAKCQRYYVLGHAAFATGLLVSMKYRTGKKYKVNHSKMANTLLITAVILLPFSTFADQTPGLVQFGYQFNALSFISGTLALAFAIPLRKVFNTLFCLFLYVTNFYQALTSGFKEPIIISVLVLGVFLYPVYKKIVIFTFVPALLLLFTILPTYNTIFRKNAWEDNVAPDEAYKIALNATLHSAQEEDGLWGFLVYRLSEVDMFSTFLKSTPQHVDYYGFDLVKQALIAVIPRFFWPGKPSTEELVMERVYNAGVVYRASNVSAKPAYIVDGYLSAGAFGVFLALFIYGAVMQLISQHAEFLFGGYILGTALIFSGLFQIFWRGLSFEFLLNSVFWSYITMLIIHKIFRFYNILEEV